MKSVRSIFLAVGLSIAAGLSGYWLGGWSEAKITQVRDSSSQAAALLALEPGLNSADPNVREHALWLSLGELRGIASKQNQSMPGDLAAMEVAITYAKLAQVRPGVDPPGRSDLLMSHAVSACAKTASPNCNAEALSLIGSVEFQVGCRA